MKLENVTAELRPRSNWEAADLGAALTRRDYGALLIRQAVIVVPLWVVLAAVFYENPGWALVFIWWLKPLYERVSLFYLSRSLFGDRPPVGETLRAAPRLLMRDLFMGLALTRFSVSRSVYAPVNQLEGLRWGGYSRRAKVLGRYASGGGVTAVMGLMEVGVVLGLVGLAALLMPFATPLDWKSLVLALLRFEAGTVPWDAFWMLNVLYAGAVFLLAPFYAGAGFGIYINARTLIEGWDIELGLRRLGGRISGEMGLGGKAARVAALLACGFLACGAAGRAGAAPEPKEVIGEVLGEPEFEIHKTTRKVPKLKMEDIEYLGEPRLRTGGSALGRAIFYALMATGAGVVLWMIWRNRGIFFGGAGRGEGGRKVRTVMGMEVGAESLPDDVPAAALAAWDGGDARRALGLLYRGSICWLVERGKVGIRESDTEHDCLERTRTTLTDAGRRDYFAEVTGHWVSQAYGNRRPAEDVFRAVCARWKFGLGEAPEGAPLAGGTGEGRRAA